jgi:hypothetical protein
MRAGRAHERLCNEARAWKTVAGFDSTIIAHLK